MLVEPSDFRTDWAGRSANESKIHIDDYAMTAGAGGKRVRSVSGEKKGDPVRAASAIVAAVEAHDPPHHLLLGRDAYEGAVAKITELRADFTLGEAVA